MADGRTEVWPRPGPTFSHGPAHVQPWPGPIFGQDLDPLTFTTQNATVRRHGTDVWSPHRTAYGHGTERRYATFPAKIWLHRGRRTALAGRGDGPGPAPADARPAAPLRPMLALRPASVLGKQDDVQPGSGGERSAVLTVREEAHGQPASLAGPLILVGSLPEQAFLQNDHDSHSD